MQPTTHNLTSSTTENTGQVVYWRGYSLDTPDDQARRLFTARYGCAPDEVKRARGLVLAGPIPAVQEVTS
jgi:hypothetical protein